MWQFRYSRNRTTVGLLLSVFVVVSAKSQDSDTLDVFMPRAFSDAYHTASAKFCDRWSEGHYVSLDVYKGALCKVLAQTIVYEWAEGNADCAAESSPFLLAWQVRMIGDSVRINNALFWCRWTKKTANSGKSEQNFWGLIALSQVDWNSMSRWYVASPDGVGRYDHPPTNEEVYAMLDKLRVIESRMFTSNPYDWQGVSVEFVDGDVREKTWEAVIGEKPTRLFPNGK